MESCCGLGLWPAVLTAKGSEIREVDMAWVDTSIWEPRITRMVDEVGGLGLILHLEPRNTGITRMVDKVGGLG